MDNLTKVEDGRLILDMHDVIEDDDDEDVNQDLLELKKNLQ